MDAQLIQSSCLVGIAQTYDLSATLNYYPGGYSIKFDGFVKLDTDYPGG